MKVLSKWRCESVTSFKGGVAEVALVPVTTGAGNESWSRWTPSGSMKMTVTVPETAKAFEPGREYMVTFEPVEAAP